MEHYVTLFDSLFLPQGLALHRSMERHVKDYTLWILCVDDAAYQVLTRLRLPNVRLLPLDQLETPELQHVKPTRSKSEYCWTLTPFAPRFVFEADPGVARVTYLDADLWFRKHPRAIFRELEQSGRSVLITDHGYAPEHDQSADYGQYCVQFLTFTRGRGEQVRRDWEQKCIEWCFNRREDGKFGDQQYLDEWPERFPEDVWVLRDKELLLAPWNLSRFPYGNAVVYHFHGLRILSERKCAYGEYPIPPLILRGVYLKYEDDLRRSIAQLKNAGGVVRPQAGPRTGLRNLYYWVKKVLPTKILTFSTPTWNT